MVLRTLTLPPIAAKWPASHPHELVRPTSAPNRSTSSCAASTCPPKAASISIVVPSPVGDSAPKADVCCRSHKMVSAWPFLAAQCAGPRPSRLQAWRPFAAGARSWRQRRWPPPAAQSSAEAPWQSRESAPRGVPALLQQSLQGLNVAISGGHEARVLQLLPVSAVSPALCLGPGCRCVALGAVADAAAEDPHRVCKLVDLLPAPAPFPFKQHGIHEVRAKLSGENGSGSRED